MFSTYTLLITPPLPEEFANLSLGGNFASRTEVEIVLFN